MWGGGGNKGASPNEKGRFSLGWRNGPLFFGENGAYTQSSPSSMGVKPRRIVFSVTQRGSMNWSR